MAIIPGVYQAKNAISDDSQQGSKFNSIVNAIVNPANTSLLTGFDPVIEEVSNPNVGTAVRYREVSVSGTSALQLQNSAGMPLKNWQVELSPYQEGTGDPSPDNVRRIYGTDRLIITAAGKNLFNPNYSDYNVSSGAYLYISDCYPSTALRMTLIDRDSTVDISGCYIGFQNGITASNTFPTAYQWVIQDGSITSNATNIVPSGLLTGVFVYPQNAETFNKLLSRYYIMVEPGTTASDFTPYIAPSQTVITLPYTIYNGTIGSDGGEIRSKLVTSNNYICTSSYRNINGLWVCSFSDNGVFSNSAKNTPICDKLTSYPNLSFLDINTDGLVRPLSSQFIGILALTDATSGLSPSSIAIANDTFTRYLNELAATFVYDLNSPTQFSVAVPNIPTIQGDTNIWVTAEDGIITNFSATYVQSE